MPRSVLVLTMIASLFVALPAFAQDSTPDKDSVARVYAKPEFSPYAGREYPSSVFWGETHLHTAVSVDAGTMCTVGQEDAFRFARGEEVTTTHGLRAKLRRPLDFMVLTDHAEMYGLMPQLIAGDPEILAQEKGREWHEALTSGDSDKAFATAMEIVGSLSASDEPINSDRVVKSAWRSYTALADKYNEPGRFTALIGYEWTAIGGFNLHRNVVFRGDSSAANQTVPFSQYDSQNPEDLWRALVAFEEKTGTEVLAIPHNGNLSNGRMFTVETFSGDPLTRELAELRARMEPLVEVTQIKGDSETHPLLSPTDEFADFERWDRSNLNGTELKEDWMFEYEYSRAALQTGLMLDAQLGANPFKFGMAGGSDSHTALSTVEEENFFGKHSGVEPEPHRWEHVVIEAPDPDLTVYGWQQAAAGRTAVWATENTREAIFDAMKRKEAYATTGPRIMVRFFGEGWLDRGGERHEKVYDVVWSDGRRRGSDGKVPPVGNTVDVKRATWSNSIGAPELIAVWEDPDFDPEERAFYYARVIEIPTPRWTAYEALRFDIEMSDEVPMIVQERAYTSPIWYSPTD